MVAVKEAAKEEIPTPSEEVAEGTDLEEGAEATEGSSQEESSTEDAQG